MYAFASADEICIDDGCWCPAQADAMHAEDMPVFLYSKAFLRPGAPMPAAEALPPFELQGALHGRPWHEACPHTARALQGAVLFHTLLVCQLIWAASTREPRSVHDVTTTPCHLKCRCRFHKCA
jgi:hypothetical protein